MAPSSQTKVLEIGSIHLASAAQEGWRLAEFYGRIRAHEKLGHTVTVKEWRDGSDQLYGLIAQAFVKESDR